MTEQYSSLADFDAWEIEAYLDGEPVDHLSAFLAQNPAAQAELAEQQARTDRLRSVLYRFDCPEPTVLQAYQWHELEAEEQQRFELHLHGCPHCSAELAELEAFADTPLSEDERWVEAEAESVESAGQTASTATTQQGIWEHLQEWIDQVRVVVATLATPGGPQFAGVALRSDTTAHPTGASAASSAMLLFEADEADISLVANQRPDGTYRIDGQVFATAPLDTARFVLTSADLETPPVTGNVSNTGTFVAGRLSAGVYQLVVKLPNQAIVIPNLSLNSF
ncbi:MAG: zf-HC2 domain-containing protein [Caldilineaceae bacterium]|nr:zf-HC2 domain-containing protein [Caldilineaceae bacterium]